MITLHHLENSRSQRVLWLLEELGVPYKVKRYKRDPKTMLAPPALKKIHPLGKSPVISDGKVVVAESGAIVEYLLDTYGQGRLRPLPGTAEARRFTYWLHFSEGSAMPPLLMKLVFDKIRSTPVPFFVKPIVKAICDKVMSSFIAPNIESQMHFMEAELGKRHWFAGTAFTAADIQMSFPLEAAAANSALGAKCPNIIDWLARIHARPAYARALVEGGPYSLAG